MGRAKAWLYRADWKKGPGYVSLSSRARSNPTPAVAAALRLAYQRVRYRPECETGVLEKEGRRGTPISPQDQR
jgi:hypothetical protein